MTTTTTFTDRLADPSRPVSCQQPQLERRRRRRQVCLFGTSANPPTGLQGHMGVIQELVELRQFNEIWVLPVYRHMFDAKRHQLVPYTHRVKMCQLALQDVLDPINRIQDGISGSDDQDRDGTIRKTTTTTKVYVSTAEELCYHRLVERSATHHHHHHQNIRVGTADLLEMLQEDYPDTDYTFCLGGDTFLDLTAWKWKRSKDVLKLLDRRLLVIYRKGIQGSDSVSGSNDGCFNNEKGNNGDDYEDDKDEQCSDCPEDQNHQRLLLERIDNVNSDDSLGRDNDGVGGGDDGKLINNDDKSIATHIINSQPERGKVRLLDVASLEDVSSSMARTTEDIGSLKQILTASVVEYIMKHQLYSFAKTQEE